MRTENNQARCTVYCKDAHPYSISDFDKISDVLGSTTDFMWFDVIHPQPNDLLLLQEEFGLHQLAIEDAVKAHQRSKIEYYDDYWFLVLHGITGSAENFTIHELSVFFGKRFMITVRSTPTYPFDELELRWAEHHDFLPSFGAKLLYQLLDTLTDGYMPIAEGFIEQVDQLEIMLFDREQKTDHVLLRIYAIKKHLGRVRRSITPIRDILQPIMRGAVHALNEVESPYYRDIEDHIVRIVEQLDEARDLVNSARDVHVSLSSNRQNEISRQLTIVATVFLPLTFITGFFGQNFSWLTDHITGIKNFAIYGVGSEILGLVALLVFFSWRRWI